MLLIKVNQTNIHYEDLFLDFMNESMNIKLFDSLN
jgi:hypothetical protein